MNSFLIKKRENKVNKVGSTVMIILMLITINITVHIVSEFVIFRFDMTENGIFKLSETTIQLLNNLENDIQVYHLLRRGTKNPYTTEVLKRYEEKTSFIHLNVVDPVRDVSFINRFTSDGHSLGENSIIVEGNGKYRVIEPGAQFKLFENSETGVPGTLGFVLEEKLTNAIASIISDNTIKISYTVNHGEIDFTNILRALNSENIDIQQLHSLQISEYEGVKLIMIFAPQNDFSEIEVQNLRNYLDKGGSVWVILEPGVQCKRLEYLVNEYGLSYDRNILTEKDAGRIIGNNSLYITANATESELMVKVKNNVMKVIMPYVRCINVNEKSGFKITELLRSTDTCEKRQLNDGVIGAKVDNGEFTLAAVSVNLKSGGKMMASGTTQQFTSYDPAVSDVLSKNTSANLLFLTETIGNLAGLQSESLFVMPKDVSSKKLIISRREQIFFTVLYLVAIPSALFITGYLMWRRRRCL